MKIDSQLQLKCHTVEKLIIKTDDFIIINPSYLKGMMSEVGGSVRHE